MSVWYCIPSKRPPEEAEKVLTLWRERGYKIALWRDELLVDLGPGFRSWDWIHAGYPYPGYAKAVNRLISDVLENDQDCDWIVTGGDDVEPDMNHTAEEIALQCQEHFAELNHYRWSRDLFSQTLRLTFDPKVWMNFGVMQPTGDRYGEDARSIARYGADRAAYADRVCGSPWMGREFCLRINPGRGPLWPEYTHMFEDEELFEVASKYGVLWQRRDLIHFHNHWARKRGDAAYMPEFLKEVNSPEHWNKYKALFEQRKAAGFPGSEPL